jgi:ABC-type branched-subunit amino acid transport system ATPase component/branched-subunit amino acid ABC-type transport system permease component
MSQFLSLSLSGGVSGAVIAILASGLVLTYATTGIFNFALGAVAWSGAYVFFLLNTGLHIPTAGAGFLAICVYAPAFGLLLDKVVLRRLARLSDVPRIIGTVGLLLAIPALWLFIIESICINNLHVNLPTIDYETNPPGLGPFPHISFDIAGSATINSDQLIVFGAAFVSAVALWYLVRRTRLGLKMRATVDRDRLAELRGVNTSQISAVASILSFILAGVAGIVAAPVLGLQPTTFNLFLFVAAAAAIIGGLRSIPLAFAGGLLIGVAENLFASYGQVGFLSEISGLGTAIPSVLLLIGLLVFMRPKRRSAGQVLETRTEAVDTSLYHSKWRRRAPWIIATGIAVVYTLWIANGYWQLLMAQGFALAVAYLSITVITGLGGIVSLAQGTFVGASGLVMAMLFSDLHWPLYLAMLIGIAFSVVLGVVVALPSLRLDGLALTLATLALASLGTYVLFQIPALNNHNGGWSVDRPVIGSLDLNNYKVLAMVILLILGVCIWMVRNLRRSLWGRSSLVVRGSPAAAQSIGIYPARTKLLIFATCAGLAGLGGVLIAFVQGQATPDPYPATTSMIWVATLVLFGIERPGGAVIAGVTGSLFPAVLQLFTTSPYIPFILFGLGAIALAQHPEGAMAQFVNQNRARREKRAAKKRSASQVVPESVSAPDLVAADGQSASVRAGFGIPVTEASMTGIASLVLEGVTAGYGEAEVLHDVSFCLRPGTLTVLLGANGAGKSTLCSAIAGTVLCTSGKVWVNGQELTSTPTFDRVKRGLALVPESRGVFPGLTVDENLEVWLPDPRERAMVYDHFPLLADRKKSTGWNLSGGEQQLLSLAPMMVRPPAVLVADEPTLGLAPLAVGRVLELMKALRDQGTSVLLVEEKARHVLDLADDVLVLELGKIRWSGARAELNEEVLTEAYLGTAVPSAT